MSNSTNQHSESKFLMLVFKFDGDRCEFSFPFSPLLPLLFPHTSPPPTIRKESLLAGHLSVSKLVETDLGCKSGVDVLFL